MERLPTGNEHPAEQSASAAHEAAPHPSPEVVHAQSERREPSPAARTQSNEHHTTAQEKAPKRRSKVAHTTTLREEAIKSPNIRKAYRIGGYRAARYAAGLGFGIGGPFLIPFAIVGGITAGIWWLSGKTTPFWDKLFGSKAKKSHGHAQASHDAHGDGHIKKDDHGGHH